MNKIKDFINLDTLNILIENALQEDLSENGDITTESIFDQEQGIYVLISKDSGTLCGCKIFMAVFQKIDSDCIVKFNKNDGDRIERGDSVAKIYGKIRSILKGERVALNFLSHLSGIATKTSKFVEKTGGKAKILDTRKTIPGFRSLQKYAVLCGGGKNHRMGLYDMVMIKDNHIDGAGSIIDAVSKVKSKVNPSIKIEVETRNLEEVKEALKSQVDYIMLDNMPLEMMKKAVKIINKQTLVEASGNMALSRIKDVAETGVDFISVGELTHSVKAFDFSLRKEKK